LEPQKNEAQGFFKEIMAANEVFQRQVVAAAVKKCIPYTKTRESYSLEQCTLALPCQISEIARRSIRLIRIISAGRFQK